MMIAMIVKIVTITAAMVKPREMMMEKVMRMIFLVLLLC